MISLQCNHSITISYEWNKMIMQNKITYKFMIQWKEKRMTASLIFPDLSTHSAWWRFPFCEPIEPEMEEKCNTTENNRNQVRDRGETNAERHKNEDAKTSPMMAPISVSNVSALPRCCVAHISQLSLKTNTKKNSKTHTRSKTKPSLAVSLHFECPTATI